METLIDRKGNTVEAESIEYLRHYFYNEEKEDRYKNTQINIRMSDRLIHDIDFVSNLLHIDRSDFIRVEIAKSVKKILKEKKSISFKTVRERYVLGELNNKQYEKIVGYAPPKELLEERQKEIEIIKKGTEKTREYLLKKIKE